MGRSRVTDWLARRALRAAYLLLRAWWRFAKPDHRGAVVAVWHRGRLLLVLQSYRPGYSLPGGGVRKAEAPNAAAARELKEELGITVDASALTLFAVQEHRAERRVDTAHVYELDLSASPKIAIDRREIVWAGFVKPSAVVGKAMSRHTAIYLDAKLAAQSDEGDPDAETAAPD